MKAIVKTLFVVLIISSFSLQVNADNVEKNSNSSKYSLALTNQIKTLVMFPDVAKEISTDGFVLISFSFTNGNIQLIDANSSNKELLEYVVAKLNEVKLCDHAKNSGKVYNMRFDFKSI